MSPARRTALFSLCAALGLVGAKLAVGLATNSLGILAEAAHSATDAVGALLTLYAVTVAERPADREHQYGHGKAQHLSALGEAIILGAVAVWIGSEAVARLTGEGGGSVDPSWYAFALLGAVLAVDAARASVSYRLGRRERSAALLGNAWHFGSDFAGTLAVLVGLVFTAAGRPGADAIAAIFVAGLVLAAAIHLAVQNVGSLMDRAPAAVVDQIEGAVREVPGVGEVRSVRVREAGGEYFADVVVGIPRLEGLERSHRTMDEIEDSVERQVGRTHVTVHAEPMDEGERASERVAAAALRVPGVMEVHNVTVLEHEGGKAITLHARVDEHLSLSEAEDIVRRLKDEIAREVGAARVFVHVEPFAPDAQPARDVSGEQPRVHRAALEAVRGVAGPDAKVVLYAQGPRVVVVTTLRPGPDVTTVQEGHALASRVEDAVREALPRIDDVIVEVSEPDAVQAPGR